MQNKEIKLQCLALAMHGREGWSPASIVMAAKDFENFVVRDSANIDGTFSSALNKLKAGFRLQREGWNGKGMFIYLVPAAEYPAQRGAAKRWAGNEAMIPYGAYLAMKTVDGTVVPWLASQTDILAEDWSVLEEDA